MGALERIHESALFIPESNAKQVCVQSLGNDPQFELKLPDACLKDLERGGKICLKLKAFFLADEPL